MKIFKLFERKIYRLVIIHKTYGLEKTFIDRTIKPKIISIFPEKDFFIFDVRIFYGFLKVLSNRKIFSDYKKNFESEIISLVFYLKYLYLIYIYSTLNFFDTRIVLTTIDNSSFFYNLALIDKKRKYVAIQNGMRHLNCFKSKFPGEFIYQALTIFCFGERDIQLFKKYKHNVNNFIISGSPKSSFLRKELYEQFSEKENKYDICLISQFLPMHIAQFSKRKFLNKQNRNFIFNYIKFLELLKKYLHDNNTKFAVAMRTSSNSEFSFYKNYFDKATIKKNIPDDFTSYKLSLRSNLVVSLNSTILSELLSWRKKVLWCNPYREKARKIELDSFYFEGRDYNKFENKLKLLLNSDIKKFKSEYSQSNYINYFDQKNLSHEIIRKYILENIK